MTNEQFNEIFGNRTKRFAVSIMQLCDNLSTSRTTSVITFQLYKAATSVGANFRAFCRGRSTREMYSKICIVVEEADETLYWLEILHDSGKDCSQELNLLRIEGTEILKIGSKTKATPGN